MKYNTISVSKLYVKVTTKSRPYSNEKICLLITGSDYVKTKSNGKLMLGKAICYRELPLNVEGPIINAHIESLRKNNNYATVEII